MSIVRTDRSGVTSGDVGAAVEGIDEALEAAIKRWRGDRDGRALRRALLLVLTELE